MAAGQDRLTERVDGLVGCVGGIEEGQTAAPEYLWQQAAILAGIDPERPQEP